MPSSAALLLALVLAADPGWEVAAPGHAWSFPADHWSHGGYRNEWWYFTGLLSAPATQGAPARRFGYQVTFFRIGLAPTRREVESAWSAKDVLMGHAAVVDLSTGERVFSEVLYRAVPLLAGFGSAPDPLLAWSRGPPGTERRWELRLDGDGFEIDVSDRAKGLALHLFLRPDRPPVLQGPDGVSRKSSREGFASLYYSLTRLATQGEVRLGETAAAVRGESWMDKEFGSSQLAPDQAGWDWFALRLSDGRDLMLYLLRDKGGGAAFASGTLVDREGRPRWLSAEDFRVRSTGRWHSPATGADYPSGWAVEVPSAGLSLRIEPELPDQENRGGSAPFYWEGAVRVMGDGGARVGEGFVELTGYGEGNRPPL
jgi:predicted secreted hydrolase